MIFHPFGRGSGQLGVGRPVRFWVCLVFVGLLLAFVGLILGFVWFVIGLK